MVDRHEAAHRADASARTSGGAVQLVLPGRGPGGMWWVAWRQHRWQVLVALAVMVVVAAVMVAFELVLVARLHAVGCTVLTDPNRCNSTAAMNAYDENTWHLLRAVLVATPIVLGVFVGAPMFPREFDQRTEVFALTQSVGRFRWWVTTVTAAGVPLLVGLVGLGFLVQWCDAMTWYTNRGAFYDGTFQVQGIMPAVYGLLALAISVTAGILVRSIVGSLVTGLIVAGAAVVLIAFPLRSHLLPVTRDITPMTDVQAMGEPGSGTTPTTGPYAPGTWFLGSGTLDSKGNVVNFDFNDCMLPTLPQVPDEQSSQGGAAAVQGGSDPSDQAMDRALAKCQHRQGIVSNYIDYLPASMIWPLRGVVAGICVILAGLFLAFGAYRLRAAPRSAR